MREMAISINWMALLSVAVVTIVATVAIAALMSASNWALTPEEGLEQPTPARRVLGIALIGVIGAIVLFGLYLMIPYFH